MGKHSVKVRGIAVEVSVWQKSKTVWIASGTGPAGKDPGSIQGRTESQALEKWRLAAEYHHC